MDTDIVTIDNVCKLGLAMIIYSCPWIAVIAYFAIILFSVITDGNLYSKLALLSIIAISFVAVKLCDRLSGPAERFFDLLFGKGDRPKNYKQSEM